MFIFGRRVKDNRFYVLYGVRTQCSGRVCMPEMFGFVWTESRRGERAYRVVVFVQRNNSCARALTVESRRTVLFVFVCRRNVFVCPAERTFSRSARARARTVGTARRAFLLRLFLLAFSAV